MAAVSRCADAASRSHVPTLSLSFLCSDLPLRSEFNLMRRKSLGQLTLETFDLIFTWTKAATRTGYERPTEMNDIAGGVA